MVSFHVDLWIGKTLGPDYQADGRSRRSAPSTIAAAVPTTIPIAASIAAVTRVAVAATWIGRIGALHVGTGIVGGLRSIAEAVVVAWPLTVSVARSVAIAIAAGSCRPAAAIAARASDATAAAGRAAATSRAPADGSASRCLSRRGPGEASGY
ncbi:hypothetical protein HPT29_010195 [Microvirga terrae]|uniref:Uncharacterized protein n=1 Tax=Microvirga terrae TaxID=2740529 RepID=A0ABY5RW24_9HYPH|nr:hypothetical protein [Microvirga terrae]UVF21455.1 hypothetical protein HPT29_010195 [Microvirga terrae]